LYVPVEITPLRERSASEGAPPVGIKTMNPEDKYLTPRPPPAVPKLPRLNTSPSMLNRKRSARSVSPTARSPWSARAIFGLKGPFSAHPDDRDRGRIVSPIVWKEKDTSKRKAAPLISSSESRHVRHIPGTMASRDPSPHSLKRALSQHHALPENSLSTSVMTIPDEILEECEDEDDGNFATCVDIEKDVVTSLSPPPSRKPSRLRTSVSNMKPLPMLPTESDTIPPPIPQSPSIVPSPLRVSSSSSKVLQSQLLIPRSHFSIDTISNISPTDSQFSNTPSISDSYDEEDADAVTDDSFAFTPPAQLLGNGAGRSPNEGFHYSLPRDEDFGSDLTIRKTAAAEATGRARDEDSGIRATIGISSKGGVRGKDVEEVEIGTALDQFLAEMGYLGNAIVGKAI
jgi:hypothetical protein